MNLPPHRFTSFRALLCAGLLAGFVPAWAQNAASANAAAKPGDKSDAQTTTAPGSSQNSSGQGASQGGGSKKDDQGISASSSGAYQQAVSDAKAFAKSNNLAAAEQTLTRFNTFKSNTADWHVETTQRLTQAADDSAQEGDADTAVAFARQSLRHLDQVETLTRDARTQAKAKAMAGSIQQRFLGDPTAAIASYQAALQLAPDDAPTKEALDQLQRADANLRAKIRPKKK